MSIRRTTTRRSTASPTSAARSTTGRCEEADDSDYFGYRNLDEQRHHRRPADRHLPPRLQRRCLGAQPHPLAAGRPVQPDQRAAGHLLPRRPPAVQPIAANAATATRSDFALPEPDAAARLLPSRRPARPRTRPGEPAHSTTRPTSAIQSGEAGHAAQHPGRRRLPDLGGLSDRDSLAVRAIPTGRRSRRCRSISISNPVTIYTGPINYTVTARSRSETWNGAIYAFDTLEIGEMFELNGGVRLERNEAHFRNVPLPFYPPGTASLTRCAAGAAAQRGDALLLSRRRGVQADPPSPASTSPSAMRARRPRRRSGSAAPAVAAADLRQSLRRRARRPRAPTRSAARPTCSTAGCS